MKIEQTTPSAITELWAQVEPRVQKSKFLEDAAQELASALRTQFQESAVLARVYFTVPFGSLAATNKAFVQKLAESAGAASELKATTPVLSLIGTSGQETDWNDRRKSKGHMGIPLISSAFVDAIPMIARLLKELGVPVDWVDSHDSDIIKKSMDRSVGLFFVENAADAKDHQGRQIIPAQDFVSGYNVKSVFGVGGHVGGQIFVIVVFCRDTCSRATAEQFLALTNLFKTKTTALVKNANIFSDA